MTNNDEDKITPKIAVSRDARTSLELKICKVENLMDFYQDRISTQVTYIIIIKQSRITFKLLFSMASLKIKQKLINLSSLGKKQ